MSRRSSNQMAVFPAEGGFRVLRREPRDKAERLVMLEVLRPEFDQATGDLLGYRVLGADLKKVDSEVRSVLSSTTITAREMQLNLARSRTYGLNEEHRAERMKAGDAPEDAVERVQAKIRVYAVVGSARGDILRVWPRNKALNSLASRDQ